MTSYRDSLGQPNSNQYSILINLSIDIINLVCLRGGDSKSVLGWNIVLSSK
eukprot:CAMPEP_0113643742 /NCGR_PEP_ID=MMETSP0017_2-20120614/23008_1 /TAXON_ID=2856 /ORGANISM="Cylindrotheca closterium" /LENGTH=50 /DNA_ID=CAMNT_0000555289 /DNA_START=110 /DNA_END=259 /DNA_ORIENTATION=+ /assembly_acc=CAM_ASM_000147